jgi:cytochrome d ubiquinol oxidase subunit I
MVGTGFLLLGLSLWFALAWWRRRDLPRSRWFLRGAALSGVLSVITLEAGWIVTEVGRQPWTVVGHLLTRDAVTTTGDLWPFFLGTVVIYLAVGVATVLVLRSMQRRWRRGDEDFPGVPYGPSDEGAAVASGDGSSAGAGAGALGAPGAPGGPGAPGAPARRTR